MAASVGGAVDGGPHRVVKLLRVFGRGADGGEAEAAVNREAREHVEDNAPAARMVERQVSVRYVAGQDDNTIDVHVYRYPGEMQANESFLVDAITVAPGTDTSENTQLVDDATCGA